MKVVKWKYIQADLLQRDITEVFVEKELKEALCRLNPDIAANPDKAEEVIHKLQGYSHYRKQCGFGESQ
jgi:type I restriction enzyme R subunit